MSMSVSKRVSRMVLVGVVLLVTGGIVPAAAQEGTLPPWRENWPSARETAQILVGDSDITVELATTSSEQQLGLGYRNGLETDKGMLFVFEDSVTRTFWMKGMRFCLDIIWIDGGVITGAAERFCPDPDGTADVDRERVASPGGATYVLEMDAGWLDDHNYGTGTPVDVQPR